LQTRIGARDELALVTASPSCTYGSTRQWAGRGGTPGIRNDIRSFIAIMPDALMHPGPAEPVPFSTRAPGRCLSAGAHWRTQPAS